MTASRRRFLVYSGTAALSTVVAIATGSHNVGQAKTARSLTRNNAAMAQMHAATFKPLEQSTFRIQGKSGSTPLKLMQVSEHPMEANMEQFSLAFEGSRQTPLAQGTYRLKHPQLGQMDLFLVPAAPGNRSQSYNATFSRVLT